MRITTALALGAICFALLSRSHAVQAQFPGRDSFAPLAGGDVKAMSIQPDGKLLVGGGYLMPGGSQNTWLARFNIDGSLDAGFKPLLNGDIMALAPQEDGRILVGGEFSHVGDQLQARLARINADGSFDGTFRPRLSGGDVFTVAAIVVQPDGRILVAGSFFTVNGLPRQGLARLYPNGEVDRTFNPITYYQAFTFAPQTDGKIVVGGMFTYLGESPHAGVGRFNADGTVDESFSPSVNGRVDSVIVQPDGKILIGGSFSSVSGLSRKSIARLESDGRVDADFVYVDPDPIVTVRSMALLCNGNLLIGGGHFPGGSMPIRQLRQLSGGGDGDPAFTTSCDALSLITIHPDGRILVVGTALAGRPVLGLGRLDATAAAVQNLRVDGGFVSWIRQGGGPEVWRTDFAWSTNGVDWTPLGNGLRIPNGWRCPTGSVPPGATLRARGFVAGGGRGSAIVEASSILPTGVPPRILTAGKPPSVMAEGFGFDYTGTQGKRLVVQSSRDLITWTPVQTNTIGAADLRFVAPEWQARPECFYRLEQLP